MKKKTTKVNKIKIGDRVWLRIPHNGKVDFVFKNGSVRVELDEITRKTMVERFGPSEIEVIK